MYTYNAITIQSPDFLKKAVFYDGSLSCKIARDVQCGFCTAGMLFD